MSDANEAPAATDGSLVVREFEDECVCGGNRLRPNRDCERCCLVSELERTRNMVLAINRTEAELRRMEQLVILCRELDEAMDSDPDSDEAAAILNGIRSTLSKLDDKE